MMVNQYETVIIFSPILSEDELKKEVKKFKKMLEDGGASIIEERSWGLRQLAYPIKAKSNGIYYIIEFNGDGNLISKLEVEYKRDENILRFLTTSLDKFGVDYNNRRRAGLVGKERKAREAAVKSIKESTTLEA
ncbi:MAG TPA: 30S ribosomal protein S6 [Bacteroidetes bacterium]|nr:30S ribosomal protein S6 [Bacteroidota bacterium]